MCFHGNCTVWSRDCDMLIMGGHAATLMEGMFESNWVCLSIYLSLSILPPIHPSIHHLSWGAVNWSQDFMHARQAIYHWAKSQAHWNICLHFTFLLKIGKALWTSVCCHTPHYWSWAEQVSILIPLYGCIPGKSWGKVVKAGSTARSARVIQGHWFTLQLPEEKWPAQHRPCGYVLPASNECCCCPEGFMVSLTTGLKSWELCELWFGSCQQHSGAPRLTQGSHFCQGLFELPWF
jgi:hypothetical protein